jgi:Ni/Co efflux regulator RcnB
MKKFLTTAAAILMLAAPMSEAFAQGWNNSRNDNNRYERQDDRRDDRRGPSMMRPDHDNYGHRNWRKGGRIERHDWNRGQRVDYRRYKLQRPARGYEWRRVDNNYVLAAAATGLIAALVIANSR